MLTLAPLLTCALVACGVYWVMLMVLFVRWDAVGAPFGDVRVEDQTSRTELWLWTIAYGVPGIVAIIGGVGIWRIAGRRFAKAS